MELNEEFKHENCGLSIDLENAKQTTRNKWFLSLLSLLSVVATSLSLQTDALALLHVFQRPELASSYSSESGVVTSRFFSGNPCTVPAVGTNIDESIILEAVSMSISEINRQYNSNDQRLTITYEGLVRRPIIIENIETILCKYCGKASSFTTPIGIAFVPWEIVYNVSGYVRWRFDFRDMGWRVDWSNLMLTPDPTSVPCGLKVYSGKLDISYPADQSQWFTETPAKAFPTLQGPMPLIERYFSLDEDLPVGCSVSPMPYVATDSTCGDISGSRFVHSSVSITDPILFPGVAPPPPPLQTVPIKVRLKSSKPVETLSGDDIQKATLRLFKQDAYIKDQMADETDEEFRVRLITFRSLVDQCVNCDLIGKDGRFPFKNVPLLSSVSTGEATILRPAYYTIEVTDAMSEEVDVNTEEDETNTLYFTNARILNIKPDSVEPIEEEEIELTPIDGIPKKEKLVVDLSMIGPNNYSVIEGKVQQFLEKVKIEKTPEQLEAIRRGILAERLVLSSAKFSEQLLKTMLGGLENLMGDLIDEIDFKGAKSKGLTYAEKQQKALKEKLDAEKLKTKGWQKFDTDEVVAIKTEMGALIGGNRNLMLSYMGKSGKLASKGIFSIVKRVLLLCEMDKDRADDIALRSKVIPDTLFAIMATQSLGGGSKPFVKLLLHEFFKEQEKVLLDGLVPYSYTSLTEDSLEETLNFMKTWDADNKVIFLDDRSKFNKIDKEIGDRVLETTGTITAYSTEIAGALSGFGGDVVDAIGDYGGPYGKALASLTKVLKYTSNVTTIGMPFITTYGILGGPVVEIPLPIYVSPALRLVYGEQLNLGLVEKGAAAAFGKTVPDALLRAQTFRSSEGTEDTIVTNSNLLSTLEDTLAGLNSVTTDLTFSLKNDLIPDAISLFVGHNSEEISFMNKFLKLDRSVSHIIATVQDVIFSSEDVTKLIGNYGDLIVSYSGLTSSISDMFYKVLLLDYTGPNDPLYIAGRNHVISKIESFRAKADLLVSDATTVFDETKDSITLPVVVVENIILSSDTTGGNTITSSPENFTMRAHVRNISTSAISGISAMLTVTSTENSIEVSTPLEMVVGSGTLEPDDGVEGNGNDEADVVWQFTYNGDPSKGESVQFSVDILENGNLPVTFSAFADTTILKPDMVLTDNDLDGMLDDWERANGLDDTKDDSEDDKDNDGLVNLRELDFNTDPQKFDTDGDGLSDGEEATTGVDGFITDPLKMDTDDDGVPDGSDGQPVDGGTNKKPGPKNIIDEPEVSLSKAQVFITKDQPIAIVKVMNSGIGKLSWTAVSDNEAIAIVSPSAPDLRNGDGAIIILAAPGFDFDSVVTLETTATVFDITGADKDKKEIAVRIFKDDTDKDGCPDSLETAGRRDPHKVDPQGDINGDCVIDLKDAMMAFKILREPEGPVETIQIEADVNKDGKIGIEELVFILQNFID